MFESPSFTFWNIVYTAIGVSVFWGKWGRTELRAYILSDIVKVLPVRRQWRSLIEFAIFVVLGVLVGVGIMSPVNPPQAIAAGFAWTGALTRRE